MSEIKFDYIIVGAGSAGCVLANRLVRDGRFSVALVERGRMDVNPWIHIPATFLKAHQSQDIDAVVSEPDQSLDGRRFPVPQGNVIGGGSSINGMIYMRGQAADYDDWENVHGCKGWGYKDVLPVFMRHEKNIDHGAPYHGKDGPLLVSNPEYKHPLNELVLDAAQSAGLAWNPDFNGEYQEGVGWYQATAQGGRRQSSATCFLKPVINCEQLTVFTDTIVRRICFEGRRATGLETVNDGKVQFLGARKEVILTACLLSLKDA